MLELAVLGLLHDAPMHGYELKKRLTELLGTFRAFSFGSLYPTLNRLKARGLLTEDASSPASARSRRARKVYRVTASGRAYFQALLANPEATAYTDEGFGVHLAFFGLTPAASRLQILEGRRRRVEERRDHLGHDLHQSGRDTGSLAARYTRGIQELSLEGTTREIRWLNDLIDAERRSSGPPPSPVDPQPTSAADVAEETHRKEGQHE